MRSADLPSDWDKYTLKILVGKNYEEVTRKKGHIAFVMYCKSLPSGCYVKLKRRTGDYVDNTRVTPANWDNSSN